MLSGIKCFIEYVCLQPCAKLRREVDYQMERGSSFQISGQLVKNSVHHISSPAPVAQPSQVSCRRNEDRE
jgi:hypothetical protein